MHFEKFSPFWILFLPQCLDTRSIAIYGALWWDLFSQRLVSKSGSGKLCSACPVLGFQGCRVVQCLEQVLQRKTFSAFSLQITSPGKSWRLQDEVSRFLWYVYYQKAACSCNYLQLGCWVNVTDAFMYDFLCTVYILFVNFASGSIAVLCSVHLKWVSLSVMLKLLFALRGTSAKNCIARRTLPLPSLWLDTFLSPVDTDTS